MLQFFLHIYMLKNKFFWSLCRRGKLSRVSFKEDLEQQLHDPGLGSNLIPVNQQEIVLSSTKLYSHIVVLSQPI